jgi:ATP-dependent Clp protease adaptor protein ClpS
MQSPFNSDSSPNAGQSSATATDNRVEEPWVTVLFDDPVNTMQYVSFALQKVLEIDASRAEKLMFEAHTDGRTSVFTGEREKAEAICVALHAWMLQATVVR